MIFIKGNSKQAFDKLYAENSNKIRGTLYRMLMEKAKAEILDELEQEVFIKVWKALDRFQFQSQISTWIYRISVNTAIDFLRREKVQSEKYCENEASSNDDRFKEEFEKLDVQFLLTQLNEMHRAVLILFYFEDKSLKEISDILEIELGTVKSRLNAAKKKAAEIFKD